MNAGQTIEALPLQANGTFPSNHRLPLLFITGSRLSAQCYLERGKYMKNTLHLLLLFIVSCSTSCSEQSATLPPGSYEVSVSRVSSTDRCIVRNYTINTSCVVFSAFEQQGGRNSSMMSANTAARIEATVRMEREGDELSVSMEVVVRTEGSVARSEERLTVPANTRLSSLVVENEVEGVHSGQKELIRVSHGQHFMRLALLKELPEQLP